MQDSEEWMGRGRAGRMLYLVRVGEGASGKRFNEASR